MILSQIYCNIFFRPKAHDQVWFLAFAVQGLGTSALNDPNYFI